MKNKSTLYLILAVVVLAVIALFVMKQDEGIGGSKAMSDFAFESTENINKIIITEPNTNKAELELVDGEWRLNNKFKARPENVELLLKTFRTIAVQTSVSKELKKTVVSNMATRHNKVEIYENNKLSKVYYVGSATKDHYGTYMILEKNGRKSSEPYIMHMPGFNGFLESRFYTNENDWKYSGVYNYDPLNIKSIKVTQVTNPSESYEIRQENKQVSLFDASGNAIEKYNRPLVENYILIYEGIFFNRIAEFSQEKVDSIQAVKPIYKLEVTDNSGESKEINFTYMLKENPEVDIVTGEVFPYDGNYLLGYIPGSKEILVFQYYSLGNIFANKSFFTENI